MSLKIQFKETGNWLFRYRSYLPLLLLPLLIYSLSTPRYISSEALLFAGILISLIGQMIRILTIAYVPAGTSGRNTKKQIASHLNQLGIYSVIRHPLYLGNFLMYIGPFIYAANIYSIVIYSLLFCIYYERIMFAEEAYLSEKFGAEFDIWSSKTPAFIPNLLLYKSANLKFSIKKIYEREYTGICGLFFLFILIVFLRNIIFNISPILPIYWKYIGLINILIYFTLRTLKKNNRRK